LFAKALATTNQNDTSGSRFLQLFSDPRFLSSSTFWGAQGGSGKRELADDGSAHSAPASGKASSLAAATRREWEANDNPAVLTRTPGTVFDKGH
jgi:hypothetical protein